MSTMYAETFQKIYEDLTAHSTGTKVTVKKFYLTIGATYSDDQREGCLRAFAQKKYIEFRPVISDLYNIDPAATFYMTADGIEAWAKWFAVNPFFPAGSAPKEDFIILQTKTR
jgi:hypothetical protein